VKRNSGGKPWFKMRSGIRSSVILILGSTLLFCIQEKRKKKQKVEVAGSSYTFFKKKKQKVEVAEL
jgi:hypothetical protein